jgi:23S rRNA pseudouridine1911/1915/1917 synthase
MIGRSRHDRKKMTVLTSGGRHSETAFRTVEIFDHVAARIECRLKTGRTHQIRVHMSSIGHGLIGDPVYGAAPARLFKSIDHETVRALRAFPRQALHARVLGFVHPVTGGTMRFERTMPEEMQDLNERLRAIPTPRRRK